ncbi:MAG: methionine--tRNA ligase subunit beta [Planctomycetota bacterium]|jgi:methionyl-tRNA synthetase
MLTKKLDSRIGELDTEGKALFEKLKNAKSQVIDDYENLKFSSVVRTITSLADEANRYVEQNQPWMTIKTDPEQTRTTLTAVLNAVKVITTYLKPILPDFASKVEDFLNIEPLKFNNIDTPLENHSINQFQRLAERIEKSEVLAMVEESKEGQNSQQAPAAEPIKPECTIEDFAKIDLRVAKVLQAESVEGADKLLRLKLDIGGIEKTVFAGIAQAYEPQELKGKMVICLANLKPRKMKFGLSEGMILAAGPGGKDIYMLTIDEDATAGQTVS